MTKKTDPKLHKAHTKATQAKMDEARRNAFRMYVMPTLTMRQASIIIECMKMGLATGMEVEGQYVTADEWLELTKVLLK